MKEELEWVRTAPKGRHAKSKSRLARFDELASQESQKRNETQEIYIPPGPRLGDVVVEAEGLKKGFGDRQLIDGLDFRLPKGGIVGVIGPNGAGKTTLFRMIAGAEQPDAGTLRVGDTVQLAYVEQFRDGMDDKKTVWEEISDGLDIITVGTYQTPSRAYCGRFNFKGGDQQKRIGDLSGGERNRVHLAKLLKAGGNLLLLDEPTNDLDVETCAPGRSLAGLPRLRRHHLPRPLVPGPRRHPHPGFRGRFQSGVVRGQLCRLRGGSQETPGCGRGHPAPHQVQAAGALAAKPPSRRESRREAE